MKRGDQIIPKNMWIPIFLSLACNMIAYYGSRLIMADRKHYNLSNRLDEQIPFVPWTIVIYWGCYAFWIVNYVIGCRQDREKAFRFMSADFFAKLVCLLCFLVFPTTNVRPAILGNSVWDELMRVLYRVDAADNLFPSIHCLTSAFCFIAVKHNEKIPKWYKAVSFLIVFGICISTLTTRQHVLADVIAGVALSQLSWIFVEKSGFTRRYMDIISKMEIRMARRRRLYE